MELHVAANHFPVAAFRALVVGFAVGRALGAAAQQRDQRPPQQDRPHFHSPAANKVPVLNPSWCRAAPLRETGVKSTPGSRQNLRGDVVGLRRTFLLHFSKASPGSFFVCSHLEFAPRRGAVVISSDSSVTSPERFLCWLRLGLRFSRVLLADFRRFKITLSLGRT